jgi:hypothetical protein
MEARRAIDEIRAKRPHSIKRKEQEEVIKVYANSTGVK